MEHKTEFRTQDTEGRKTDQRIRTRHLRAFACMNPFSIGWLPKIWVIFSFIKSLLPSLFQREDLFPSLEKRGKGRFFQFDNHFLLRGCAVISVSLFILHFSPFTAFAADNPLNRMRDETLSYFKPITGRIITVEGKKIVMNAGTKDSVRKGMRFQILREEAPFKHPVTKEPLGKLESLVGKLEIKEVNTDSSVGEIIEGDAREGDKARISEMKVNLLFCQSKDADWYLTDSYYRLLKETGRFNLIDTSLDTDVPAKAVEEAKRLRADIALVLTSRKEDPGTVLSQKLFWVADGVQFSEMNTNIEASLEKELSSGDEFFRPSKEEAWRQFDLAFDARLMTVCDIDGDGKQEIVLDAGKEISVYTVGVDIQPALGGIKIEGSVFENRLRIDSIDLNRNGRDEIVVTAMKNDDIVSHIYEFNGSEFVLLYKGNVFLRAMGNALIAQSYSRSEGFTGDVFAINWDGEYKKGDTLRLPKGVNIYDFIYIDDPRSGRLLLAYDEWGFLNLYDGKDMRIWRSKTDAGGFLTTFEKKAPSLPVDRGEWSVKDRLWRRNNEILSVKRFPLLDMVKGLGYKKAQITKLWWNGLSMEEGVLIDNIDGTLFDYAVSGDKIMVLSSPLFGIKAGNILKGENPLKTELYIYKMQGM